MFPTMDLNKAIINGVIGDRRNDSHPLSSTRAYDKVFCEREYSVTIGIFFHRWRICYYFLKNSMRSDSKRRCGQTETSNGITPTSEQRFRSWNRPICLAMKDDS